MDRCQKGLLLSGLMLASSAVMAGAPDFKEGEWGTRYRMEVMGAPFPMPPITVRKTTCLTKKNYVPDNTQKGQDCKVTDTKVSGNTVSWKMRCRTAEGTIEGDGKITYKGERYVGSMESRIYGSDGASPMSYRYNMEGEWLGVCAK